MTNNKDCVPVIDLFAGPGGLGEGFAAYRSNGSKVRQFDVRASVEMNYFAHQTLELRSFFHEFEIGKVPHEYYRYLRQAITREELYALYPKEAKAAQHKAIHARLGVEDDDKIVDSRIEKVLSSNPSGHWVLVGGPPCQAYSTIGRSRRQVLGAGSEEHKKDERNFLYLQYLRTIGKYRPTVFVMENVTGILSAQVNGVKMFPKILKDLSNPIDALKDSAGIEASPAENEASRTYRIYSLVVSKEDEAELKPKDFIIEAEKYGIPQARHRVILFGVRGDIDIQPTTLSPKDGKVTVKDILNDLPPIRSQFTRESATDSEWMSFIREIQGKKWFKEYAPAGAEMTAEDVAKLELRMNEIIMNLNADLGVGGEYITTRTSIKYRPDWFSDPHLGGVINHSARAHMKEDLHRYFFAAAYADVFGRSPRMKNFPKQLLPKHRNINEAVEKGTFEDRFRVQEAERPSTTITCHIAKDGHYSIHYDPRQCRSLSVREAARLQTFPDNYHFFGSKSHQYHQVGNAVPPLLSMQIAEVVHGLLSKIRSSKTKVEEEKSAPVLSVT